VCFVVYVTGFVVLLEYLVCVWIRVCVIRSCILFKYGVIKVCGML
jgi:hypothetical protein